MAEKKYDAQKLLKDLVDDDGLSVFQDNEITLLNESGYKVLQDLFLFHSKSNPNVPRFDANARQAKALLLAHYPNSNSIIFRIDDLYKSWLHELHTKRQRQKNEAALTTPLTVTAPLGRNSRLTRIFVLLQVEDLSDLNSPQGMHRICDKGYIGIPTDEDDFGYNG